MRNRKFAVSAAAILLAGAITAGLAARAVIAPPTGEVRSAGVVTIPTVLGQTAEEVLFYPWAVYHSESLTPIREDTLAGIAGIGMEELEAFGPETIGDLYGITYSSDVATLLLPFELPAGPVECDVPGLLEHLMWNEGQNGSSLSGGTHLFLSDYPATLKDSQIPVTLSMAASGGSNRYGLQLSHSPRCPQGAYPGGAAGCPYHGSGRPAGSAVQSALPGLRDSRRGSVQCLSGGCRQR